jgi:hypothetical protein
VHEYPELLQDKLNVSNFPVKFSTMFCQVMFQGVSRRLAGAVSDSYPPMSQIEVRVCGRIAPETGSARSCRGCAAGS